MRSLLIDYMPFSVERHIIEESIALNKPLIVSGIIQRADALNQNNRIYPKEILVREVNKYMDLIKERRSLGELDHPDSSVINLANVSHLITDLKWNGNDLIGTIEILGTPAGNILKELFKSNVRVGISSRGLGSTRELGGGKVEVQDDFEILCWDMVSNPSTQGSFMSPVKEGLIKESVEAGEVCIGNYCKINEIIVDILSSFNDAKEGK
jgi:hypothetical protein